MESTGQRDENPFTMRFMKRLHLALSMLPALAIPAYLNLQTDHAKDEKEIRMGVESMALGWNSGSGAKFAAPFADHADYVVVNGMWIRGKAEIDKGHQMLFDGMYKGTTNGGTVKRIRFIRPDVAIVHVEWSLKFNGMDNKAMNTQTWAKNNGKWVIEAFQNTPVAVRGGG